MRGTEPIRFDLLSAERLAEDADWWSLYDASFPPAEREPREVILRSLDLGAGVALRAGDVHGTVALATLHLLRDPSAVFLVYLAVSPRLRGRGVGGDVFRHCWSAGSQSLEREGLHPRGMVWEVDDPETAPDDDEFARRIRRIDFFRRLGGELLSTPYCQPPVDGVESVQMRLMYLPALPDTMIDVDQSLALVHAMYFEKYGACNGIGRATLDELLSRSS